MSGPNIILASTSQIRKKILADAGLVFSIKHSDTNEAALKKTALAQHKAPSEIAEILALAKAEAIEIGPNALSIGADQLLEMDGEIFDKPKSMDEAKARLQNMRGREHRLIGALAVCERGQAPWIYQSVTRLHMRDFSDTFLDTYLELEGADVLKSVGGYMFERRGSQLFEWVEGDFFSILGLPLLPLLAHLRSRGAAQL